MAYLGPFLRRPAAGCSLPTWPKAPCCCTNAEPQLRFREGAAGDAVVLGLASGYERGTVGKMAQLGWELLDLNTRHASVHGGRKT